jgi:trans-aconitate methyltransferase
VFQYNHNKHYADLLVRQVPPQCQNALDIGCGDGSFARRLAERFGIAVTGIDRDPAIIKRAQTETLNPRVQFVEADFLRYHFQEQFDFISASASLHHMPFDQALEKMVSLLRPGGVLAVLGLFCKAGLTDLTITLIATSVDAFYALSRGRSSESGAPVKPPDMFLREIRETVSSHLPNACLRRLLLWRYLLIWQKPQEQAVA